MFEDDQPQGEPVFTTMGELLGLIVAVIAVCVFIAWLFS